MTSADTDGIFGPHRLPLPAFEAIKTALATFGKGVDTMTSGESLCPAPGRNDTGISRVIFFGNLWRYLLAPLVFRLALLRKGDGALVGILGRVHDG